MTSDTLILVSTYTAAALALAAIVSLCADLLLRDRAQIQRRLQSEFSSLEKQTLQKSPLFRDLKMLQSKTEGNREEGGLLGLLDSHVAQSGLPWSTSQIVWSSVTLGILGIAITYLFTAGVAASAAVGIAGFSIPILTIEVFRQRRLSQLTQQLPDAFDQLKRSIRAGHSLMIAMQQVANDFPEPLSDEFAMCCQQHDLGLSHSQSLQDLARRINIMELRMFVISALVQREAGGNFAEILTSLSNVVRQRLRLASRVKASTAEGRMQAVVLATLPLIAGAAMCILNAEYARVLLDRPRLLVALIASEAIGVLWIRRIVNFDY